MHVATDFTLVFSDVRATELQLSGGKVPVWHALPLVVYRSLQGLSLPAGHTASFSPL